jgi:hypothetical protein
MITVGLVRMKMGRGDLMKLAILIEMVNKKKCDQVLDFDLIFLRFE